MNGQKQIRGRVYEIFPSEKNKSKRGKIEEKEKEKERRDGWRKKKIEEKK